MRIKTELAERPPEFTVAHEGTDAVIVFYTHVEEEQREESTVWTAISWVIKRPWLDNIVSRISANVQKWLEEAMQESYDVVAEEVRAQRDILLYETDWTQVSDNALSPEERQRWAEYRQALRDVTAQENFPYDVEWPTEP